MPLHDDRQPIPFEDIAYSPEAMSEAYCELQGFVMSKVFKARVAADCWCPSNASQRIGNWASSREVYEFITDAVKEKIAKRVDWQVHLDSFVVQAETEAEATVEAEAWLDRNTATIQLVEEDE